MAKEFTKEELEEQSQKLQEEIKKLEMIIEASDTSTFEIMIQDIKNDMFNNVAEENWKMLKQNKTKVEQFRNIVKIIQNQGELLESKKNELDDIQWKLEHFQPSLFDAEQPEAIKTDFHLEDETELYTGDVYKKDLENGEVGLYLIAESKQLEGSFAIISNAFELERLMQYPSNMKNLENTSYIGNIFIDDDSKEEALKCADIILEHYNSTLPKESEEGSTGI